MKYAPAVLLVAGALALPAFAACSSASSSSTVIPVVQPTVLSKARCNVTAEQSRDYCLTVTTTGGKSVMYVSEKVYDEAVKGDSYDPATGTVSHPDTSVHGGDPAHVSVGDDSYNRTLPQAG